MTIEEQIKLSLGELAAMNTHTELREWATAKNMATAQKFALFKKALLKNGIDYNNLRENPKPVDGSTKKEIQNKIDAGEKLTLQEIALFVDGTPLEQGILKRVYFNAKAKELKRDGLTPTIYIRLIEADKKASVMCFVAYTPTAGKAKAGAMSLEIKKDLEPLRVLCEKMFFQSDAAQPNEPTPVPQETTSNGVGTSPFGPTFENTPIEKTIETETKPVIENGIIVEHYKINLK